MVIKKNICTWTEKIMDLQTIIATGILMQDHLTIFMHFSCYPTLSKALNYFSDQERSHYLEKTGTSTVRWP